MAVLDQPKTSYSDTTAQARVISDVIQMVDPRDTPLIAKLGLDGAREKFKIQLNGHKVELLEDELDPLEDALDGALDNSATTSIGVDDASKFQDGHIILIDSEKMVVKSADATGNTVDVYGRGFGSTAAASHTDNSVVTIIGMARLEGDDADYGPIVDMTAPYNYTSIFQKAVQVSGTQQVISQYGIDDEFMYQANKAVPHLLRLAERQAFYGERDAGSGSAPRSMGGLSTFITDNTVDAGGGITKADVDALMEEITMDGGVPRFIGNEPANCKRPARFVG